jgi:ketosteroid isomerase-like protein
MANAESPSATSSFADFMRQRRPEVARAYVRGDADPLTEVSTTRDPASFFPPRSGYIEGAERVIEVNRHGAQQFGPDGETDLEVLHMDEDGDLAYWVGLQHAAVSVNGHTSEMHLRITELFRREDGSWKLVHRHADPHASPSP